MRTPEEVLAQLGITPDHVGDFSYAELRAAVAHTLELETNYHGRVMHALLNRPAPVPQPYTSDLVAQEQAAGEAWLLSPAQLRISIHDDNDLSVFNGMGIRVREMPYDPDGEHPPF